LAGQPPRQRRPRVPDRPLSIRTAAGAPGRKRPYDDQLEEVGLPPEQDQAWGTHRARSCLITRPWSSNCLRRDVPAIRWRAGGLAHGVDRSSSAGFGFTTSPPRLVLLGFDSPATRRQPSPAGPRAWPPDLARERPSRWARSVTWEGRADPHRPARLPFAAGVVVSDHHHSHHAGRPSRRCRELERQDRVGVGHGVTRAERGGVPAPPELIRGGATPRGVVASPRTDAGSPIRTRRVASRPRRLR